MVVIADVVAGNPMNRGSQQDFLQRERKVLVARRGRLNQNQIREYLPPSPSPGRNQSADQESRTGSSGITDEPVCGFRFFGEGDLAVAGLVAADCSVVNETCSDDCGDIGSGSGPSNCDIVEDEVCDVVTGEECRPVEEQVCQDVCDGLGGPAPAVDEELSEVQDAIVKAVQQQLILVIKQEIEEGLDQFKTVKFVFNLTWLAKTFKAVSVVLVDYWLFTTKGVVIHHCPFTVAKVVRGTGLKKDSLVL